MGFQAEAGRDGADTKVKPAALVVQASLIWSESGIWICNSGEAGRGALAGVAMAMPSTPFASE